MLWPCDVNLAWSRLAEQNGLSWWSTSIKSEQKIQKLHSSDYSRITRRWGSVFPQAVELILNTSPFFCVQHEETTSCCWNLNGPWIAAWPDNLALRYRTCVEEETTPHPALKPQRGIIDLTDTFFQLKIVDIHLFTEHLSKQSAKCFTDRVMKWNEIIEST